MVGSDLTKICGGTVRQKFSGMCKVLRNVRKLLSRRCVSLSARVRSRLSVRLLGEAPSTFLNSYHCGLPRVRRSGTVCRGVFRVLGGLSVCTFVCVNKGSSVSAVGGLSSCTVLAKRARGFLNIPGAVSGSLTLASRAPKFKDTTGCVNTSAGRIVHSTLKLACGGGVVAVVRVVKHGTK